MTRSFIVDHTFFDALFFKENKYHEHAIELIRHLDHNMLYITHVELIEVMNLCQDFDKRTKTDLFNAITDIATVLTSYSSEIHNEYMNIYTRFNGEFNYTECINIYYMKHRSMWSLVSFNSNYDHYYKIKRYHNVGKKGEILRKI